MLTSVALSHLSFHENFNLLENHSTVLIHHRAAGQYWGKQTINLHDHLSVMVTPLAP